MSVYKKLIEFELKVLRLQMQTSLFVTTGLNFVTKI